MKTHFIKYFNLFLNLLKTLLFTTIIFSISSWFIHRMSQMTELVEKPPFSFVLNSFIKISKLSLLVFIVAIIAVIIIALREIIDRTKYDSLDNLYLSISKTRKNRKFLYQQINKGAKHSISENLFNKSLKNFFTDIRNVDYIVYIKYPSSEQSEAMLTEKMDTLKKQITKSNKDITYFSQEKYEEDGIWIIGTRQKKKEKNKR